EAMKNGEKVQLVGFGTFEGKDRPERTCMNPATKQKITVKATRVPTFKAGKALKEVIAK
ncbi:MAG: HU family DNA-binding protein, partial [Oscillospiraceae bacterium]